MIDPIVRLKPVRFDEIALPEHVAIMRDLPVDARDILFLEALGVRTWATMLRKAANASSRWSEEAAWRWLRKVCNDPDGFRAIAVRHADKLPPAMLMTGMNAAKEIAPVLLLGDPFVIGGKMAGRQDFMARAVFVF